MSSKMVKEVDVDVRVVKKMMNDGVEVLKM